MDRKARLQGGKSQVMRAREAMLALPASSRFSHFAAFVSSVYWLVLAGVPPSPRYIGIIGLGRDSREIFEFKGLIRKIFWNKELGCQRALKMGLGQLRGPSWLTGTPRNCPNQISIVAHDGVLCQWISITDDERQSQLCNQSASHPSQKTKL